MDGIASIKQQAQALLEQTVGDLQNTLGGKTRIQFSVDGLPLQAHALSAREGLNSVAHWQVHCAAPHNLDSAALLGKSAELTLQGGDGLSRSQPGVITAVDYRDDLPDPQQGHFVFHLQSSLARLARRQRWRLVQQQRVVELVSELLREYQLEVDNRLALDYPVHSWLLQGGETDLAWLQRLLAEEGIGFYCEAGEHGETVVLFDQPGAVERAPRGAIAVIKDSGAVHQLGQQQQGVLTSVQRWYQQVPVRVEAHIQGNPSEHHPQVMAVGAADGLKDSLYLGGNPDVAEAKRRATLRLEYWQGHSQGLSAQGSVADLAPGHWVAVQGVGPCLVVSAELDYGEPDDHRGSAPRALHWQGELKTLDRPWRPQVPVKPELPAVFPARVEATGPYAELDGSGRRRARLHLDQDDSQAAQASPPLRQLQPFAGQPGKDGQASGWDWPLRNGAQVLVSLLNNDFSQPYILGYLPASDQVGPGSNRNPSQYRLLTPAGHHLNLDDHKSAELITLHTPQGNCVLTLDANSDSPHVLLACQQGGLILRSGGDQHIQVGKASQTGVQGDITTQVGLNTRIQSQEGLIHNHSATNMTLQASQHLNLEAGLSGDVSIGDKFAMRANQSAEIKVGRELLMKLGGKLNLQADQDLIIEGDGSADITIHQNGGGFTIKPDGRVRLFGNTVTIKGKQGASFNGDMKWNIPAGPDPDEPVPGEVAAPAALDNLLCNFFALQCAKQSAAIIPLVLPEDKQSKDKKPRIVHAYFAKKVTSQNSQEGDTSYTVKGGDNLSRIASQYGISWQDLKSHNNLSSDVIHPGQELSIPGSDSEGNDHAEYEAVTEVRLGADIFLVVEAEGDDEAKPQLNISFNEEISPPKEAVLQLGSLPFLVDGVEKTKFELEKDGDLYVGSLQLRPQDDDAYKDWVEAIREDSVNISASVQAGSDAVFADDYAAPSLILRPHQQCDIITGAMLANVYNNSTLEECDIAASELNWFISRGMLDSELRLAHFLGQTRQETAGHILRTENLNYRTTVLKAKFSYYTRNPTMADAHGRREGQAANQVAIANHAYANRIGNGSIASGDGWRYRGRGIKQLTGRSNYREFTVAHRELWLENVDFEAEPDLVSTEAKYAVRSGIWFWMNHNLGLIADQGGNRATADAISSVINRYDGAVGFTNRYNYMREILEPGIFSNVCFNNDLSTRNEEALGPFDNNGQ